MTKTIGKEVSQTIWIPDLWKEVVKGVSKKHTVYFDYGPVSEIVKNLEQKEQAVSEALRQKFPLIWLVGDYVVKRREFDYYGKLSADVIITTGTSNQYTLNERRDRVYFKTLYPIYEELLNQLRWSPHFEAKLGTIPHDQIDRPYWKGEEKENNLTAQFNEYIDAIQIKGLELLVNNKH